MEWLYAEEHGGQTAAQRFDRLYDATTARATTASGTRRPRRCPGPEKLFDDTVYDRGAMALQVLRELVGDADFFEILLEWATENAGGAVDDRRLPRQDRRGHRQTRCRRCSTQWLTEPGKPAAP